MRSCQPFSALTALSLTLGYALLGACWLIAKTEGELHDRAVRWARRLAIAVTLAMVAVSLATLLVNPNITQQWGLFIASDGRIFIADGTAVRVLVPAAAPSTGQPTTRRRTVGR